jgi:DHA2 family multidrug resistance protein
MCAVAASVVPSATFHAGFVQLPQLLQINYQYTPMLSGMVLMPAGLAMMFMMPVVGQLLNHIAPKYLIGLGMAILALGMWHNASLTPDADFSFFVWARIFQTIGLPFLFIPITAASYLGLPPEKTGEASFPINVARNQGGSIGIAIAGAVLARNAQVHQSYLTSHLVPSSLPYQQALEAAIAQFSAELARPDAQQRTYALIEQTVLQQATLLSYIDVFSPLALVSATLAPLALLLLRTAHGASVGRRA